jgi:hypothetical protein
MGFVHFRLSAGVHFGCPLPGTLRFPSAEQCHLLDRVPPSRFLTALTASSTRVLRACCIPHPTMRFAAFPSHVASTTLRRSCASPRLPRDAHTLRRIPLASSRTASPRPLPSCRCRSPRTPLRDRPPRRAEAPLGMPRQVHSARGLPEHRALVVSLAGHAPPALAGPVYLLPGRRSDPFGRPSPHPAEAASGSGLPSPWPPRRSELVEITSPGAEARRVCFSHPTCCHRGGRRSSAAHSVWRRRRWEHAPRALGAAVAPKCPHTVRCASSLSRVSAGGSVATWAALLSPSAKPLAAALRLPARAGLCFATSRPPGSSGSEDPHSSD